MKHYQPKTNAGQNSRRSSIRWPHTATPSRSSPGLFMTSLCVKALDSLRDTVLPCTTAKATPSWIFCFPLSKSKAGRKSGIKERARAFSVARCLTRYSGHCLAFRPLSFKSLFCVKSRKTGMRVFLRNLSVIICRSSRMLRKLRTSLNCMIKKLKQSSIRTVSSGLRLKPRVRILRKALTLRLS